MRPSAATPPVDAPRPMTASVVTPRAAAASSEAGTSVSTRRKTLLRAALRTRATRSRIIAGSALATSLLGFATTSTAPASSASSTNAEPLLVSELTMTVGVGSTAMTFLRKVMPSILGISMSSVMTSGRSRTRRSLA